MLDLIDPYQLTVLTEAGILAIAAVGLYITIASGQLSVMHGALLGTGAYVATFLAITYQLPLMMTVLGAGAVTAIIGAITAGLCLRLRRLLLSIATLVLGEMLSIFFLNSPSFGGATGYIGAPLRTTLPVVAITLAAALLLLARLRRSTTGLALVAAGTDEVASAAIGISIRKLRIGAFAFGGGLAGVAGALQVQFLGVVIPQDLGFGPEVQLLLFVIVGGMTSYWGAVLGAVTFTVLPEALRATTLDRFWILGLILTFVILVRPRGLLVRRPVSIKGLPRGTGQLVHVDYRKLPVLLLRRVHESFNRQPSEQEVAKHDD